MITYLTGLKAEREPVTPHTYRRTSLTASAEREGGEYGWLVLHVSIQKSI